MAAAMEPLLASALWSSHSAAKTSSEAPTKRGRLSTGCHKIDTALENGLDYGTVSCISGENDAGAREVPQALLVSQLLGSTRATATVIDTGLALDVRILHQALSARMTGQRDATEQAAKVLDRVKIMKVFDFVGLTECLAELRDELQSRGVSNEMTGSESKAPRGTVGDSEDEGEDGMLDASTVPPAPAAISRTPGDQKTEPSLLLIDNITQLTAPLLKANYVNGQALLSSFMRSLSHLTKVHHICTVLTNGVTSYPNANAKDEAPSIFSSCIVQPALGRAFTYLLDTHLLVHRVSKAAGSAEKVSVIEVLHDRYDGRTGKWAAFTIDDSGVLKDITSSSVYQRV